MDAMDVDDPKGALVDRIAAATASRARQLASLTISAGATGPAPRREELEEAADANDQKAAPVALLLELEPG